MGVSLVIFGALAMAYGLAMSAMRARRSALLSQLEPLCSRFGRHRGELIHGLAFTSTPIAAGMWLAFEGARLL